MSPAERIERFDKSRHAVKSFDCGQPTLDRWLVQYASQGQRRGTSRTFVAVGDAGNVVGYYTLVAGIVKRASATAAVAAGTSAHFPIPVCLLARLAVDRRAQARGLGSRLLLDALARALAASNEVGMRAVVVNAIDEDAARFYRQFDFEPVDADGLTLMVPLAAVRSALSNP